VHEIEVLAPRVQHFAVAGLPGCCLDTSEEALLQANIARSCDAVTETITNAYQIAP
jgi:hypothetical protein